MTREAAIARAEAGFDDGTFRDVLARRVAIPSVSQAPARMEALARYLADEMVPALAAMGFACRVLPNPAGGGPFLIAERTEDPALPTVLGYGHGDVSRGQEGRWSAGLDSWRLTGRGGHWFGRGVADNKGQHSVNLAAMAAVLAVRGRLGFNARWLIETGEEAGSPGLCEIAAAEREALCADVLIASDGPRLAAGRPTVFLGTRGAVTMDLAVEARVGGHHSGNWGGLLSNPAIQLAHALACIAGPTGQVRVPDWVPPGIPPNVRAALAGCPVVAGEGDPEIDPDWGEPGLTAAEKVYGWSSFEVLAMVAGDPAAPVNAVPPRAWARGQLRFPVGVDAARVVPALRAHLDRQGFGHVSVREAEAAFPATRTDPDHPWVRRVVASLGRTAGAAPALLPNLGGSLPNDIFADVLGMPTVWVPHSWPGCAQHAPDENVPAALLREALGLMAGLYWDIGADPA